MRKRLNPVGNARLTAMVGVVLLGPVIVDLGTILFGVHSFMSLHVFVGLALTVVLFSSGLAMGILHGQALVVARRLHGPASVVWLVLFAVHALVYLKQALIGSRLDCSPPSKMR